MSERNKPNFVKSAAFVDTSEEAKQALRQHAFTTSESIRRRFAEITGLSQPLEELMLLPAKEFEERVFPPFVQLSRRYIRPDLQRSNPDGFVELVSACEQELVQVGKYLNILHPNQGYLPYIDTFHLRLLKEVGLNLQDPFFSKLQK